MLASTDPPAQALAHNGQTYFTSLYMEIFKVDLSLLEVFDCINRDRTKVYRHPSNSEAFGELTRTSPGDQRLFFCLC